MSQALRTLYCRPGVSKKNKTQVGLIAVKNIPPNTKILERPQYHGHWCYTSELHEKLNIELNTLSTLHDLYKNKKLFMQDSNKIYTFVPSVPVHEFHGEMFLNQSTKDANIVSRKDGYYSIKPINEGDELFVV
jgi:hypothetical protein